MEPTSMKDDHSSTPSEDVVSDPQAGEAVRESDDHAASKEDTTKSSGPPLPPGPIDRGLTSWLQVLASFAMWTNTFGIVNSFGVFQTYYQLTHLSHKSASQISWIGSLQACLLITVGMLSGPLFDAGWFRALNLGGSFLVVFGLMMTSLCREYWQCMLAQSVVVGVGCGLLFIPATGIIPQYFVRKRALASSIGAGGSGFGGLIYPIVFRQLQPKIGFGWAVRTIAFLALFFAIISNLCGRNKLPPSKPRKLIDMEFFKNKSLVVVSCGVFFAYMGLYVPTYYIGVYALDLGITNENLSFYLVAIMQAGSLVGRVGPSLVADKVGPVNLAVMSVLIAGILSFCWIGIKNTAGLIVFSILYGTVFGLFLGMASAAYMALMKGEAVRKFGTFFAMGLMFMAPGILIGNPISGAILKSEGGFVGLQAFSGAVLLVGGLLMVGARWVVVGWSLQKI